MTSLTEYSKKEEIGDLLLKVQDDLRGLRTRLAQDGSNVDLKSLQRALEKTENEIKTRTDKFINHLNNEVKMIPEAMIEDEVPNYNNISMENVLDISTNEHIKAYKKKSPGVIDNYTTDITRQKAVAIVQPQSVEKRVVIADGQNERNLFNNASYDNEDNVIEEISSIKIASKNFGTSVALTGLSPGQALKLNRDNRALLNPFNPKNREALSNNYSIQLPLIEQRKAFKMSTHLITGSTVDHLGTLPLVYRKNPTLVPPPITEDQAKHGLMSLVERGLIPPNARITFDPPPIAPIKIDYLDPNKSTEKPKIDENRAKELVYKLDPNYKPNEDKFEQSELLNRQKDTSNRIQSASAKQKRKGSGTSNEKDPLTTKQILPAGQPLPPPATPNQQLTDKRIHKFVIQNGFVKADTPEFISFKQFYCLHWGNIVSIIKLLEHFCQSYVILIGFIDGNKVAELSNSMAIDHKPTMEEILDLFINKEDVEKIVKTPGRRFLGPNGKTLAAIRIQTSWRRYRDRVAYLLYRKRKWAAGVIALSWLTYVKMARARTSLKKRRMRELENFRKRSRDFMKAWPKLKNTKRIIIHIPSLGYSLPIRDNMKDLAIRENYQMARLCDVEDENVDVIYVSSVPITEETLQYYSKLLSLRSAVESGNTGDVKDFTQRYKIVIPEALNSFPTHNMALSTLLKYSPKAMERIKNLIKGRDAYIIAGVLSHDDLHIADILNVPIFGTEPEIGYLYSTKSGSKRIFQSAKVAVPYGEFDIYSKQQLHECFAQAITENLNVQRWLFKLDDECDGRGIAYCDIGKNLPCYAYALKEAARYGEKWSKKWAQEATYLKILAEIPDVLSKHGIPVNTKLFPNWEAFEKAFLAQGGILEAHPPSENVTALTVSLIIEPDSTVKIFSSGDQIHAESQYSCWGLSYPQTSVDPKQLNEACKKIADACKQRNIIGYFDIDFVTFIEPRSEQQILWAIDLNIGYSDNFAMASLLYYMTNGKFDHDNHVFEIEYIRESATTKRQKRAPSNKEDGNKDKSRYAVMSSKLHHSNLSVIHYSVFFQTCRAHGIGFDIKEKQGTLFTLVDSLNHTNLGMITVGENLQATLQQFAHNLSALHQEISSANMQGKTNFLMALQDISTILDSAEDDENEHENQND